MNVPSSARSTRSLLPVAGAVLATIFLSGCQAVYVSTPLGERPHVLDSDACNGVWLVDHDIAKVTVTDAANGEFRAVGIDENDGAPVLKTYAITVRESGSWVFASMRDDESKPDRYVWALVKFGDDQLIAWLPNVEKFRALVRDKKLPGTLDGDDVALGPLSPDDLKRLTSGELGVLFEWDSPVVYRRVAR